MKRLPWIKSYLYSTLIFVRFKMIWCYDRSYKEDGQILFYLHTRYIVLSYYQMVNCLAPLSHVNFLPNSHNRELYLPYSKDIYIFLSIDMNRIWGLFSLLSILLIGNLSVGHVTLEKLCNNLLNEIPGVSICTSMILYFYGVAINQMGCHTPTWHHKYSWTFLQHGHFLQCTHQTHKRHPSVFYVLKFILYSTLVFLTSNILSCYDRAYKEGQLCYLDSRYSFFPFSFHQFCGHIITWTFSKILAKDNPYVTHKIKISTFSYEHGFPLFSQLPVLLIWGLSFDHVPLEKLCIYLLNEIPWRVNLHRHDTIFLWGCYQSNRMPYDNMAPRNIVQPLENMVIFSKRPTKDTP